MVDVTERYLAIAPRLTSWLVAGGSPYHEACDVVQSTFLKIWKMRGELYDDPAAVSGLAFSIARNLRKNLARDNARLVPVGEIRDPDVDDDADAGADGGDGSLAAPERKPKADAEYLRGRLAAAVAKLPPKLRGAFSLSQIDGLPFKEVARRTGVSAGLAKLRAFRARRMLRDELADLRGSV